MVIMDLKGITWVGNIYQKFEAMCLEVEEAVCQDTVKFVENQAQTVGASFKKFYSEAMQDLLPPSSVDPVKVAAADLSLNPYADFGVCKKPKANIKKDTIKNDKEFNEDSKVSGGVNTGYSSSLNGRHDVDHSQPPFSMGSARRTGLELCLERNEHRGVYKRKSRRNNHMPSEMPRSITPTSTDFIRVSSSSELSENHQVACGQIDMTSRPAAVDVTGFNSSRAKSCKSISGSSTMSTADDSNDTPTPNMILPVESGANNEKKLRGAKSRENISGSSTMSTAVDSNDTPTPKLILPVESGANNETVLSGAKSRENISGLSTRSTSDDSNDAPTPNMILPVESGANNEIELRCTSSNGGRDLFAEERNGTCTNSGVTSLIGSYISCDPQYNESASENCLSLTGKSGACNLDVIENYDMMVETIDENFDDSKLEETCVLVDGENFCPVAHMKDKPRSYKKKIQKAFSSKRSARKQEYEQLAVQHVVRDTGSNQEMAESLLPTFTMDLDSKKSPPRDVTESEWELL